MTKATARRGAGPVPPGVSTMYWRQYRGSPTGTRLQCKGWRQEAALRLLNNNLDPDVAEKPLELIVYGGIGRAARNWACYEAIVRALRALGDDETLLVQSGKPIGVFRTHEMAPRVLIANSNLVPRWATWEHFHWLESRGLIMYGQMTAGSWAYIGTQGILQGTYETLAAVGRRHFGGSLAGRLVLTAGLGGMGGAQPLAVTMNGGVAIVVEVDPDRIRRRIETRYLMETTDNLDDALTRARSAMGAKRALSIGLLGNAAEVFPEIVRRGIRPDAVTDQTSAHDELNGYVPAGMPYAEALRMRREDPAAYAAKALDSIAVHVRAMLDLKRQGCVVFEYGNNIRGQAKDKRGVADAFGFPGFVPEYIRPLFCVGKGPFRWVALSGDAADIRATEDAALAIFPRDEPLGRWLRLAREQVEFQGLPSRVCWLGLGERAAFALRINDLVKRGKIRAPIVVTRDHLDSGSVASPNRETEAMRDGSDAVADWPILNALLNCAAGADIVSFHHGGGVGMGYSLHANNHVVLDGTKLAARKAEGVFTTDPGLGVLRHADAGYEDAIREAKKKGLKRIEVKGRD